MYDILKNYNDNMYNRNFFKGSRGRFRWSA